MECLQLRADSYVKVDELQKALLDYTKMITLNPGNEDIYLKRINLYIKMKSYSEALSDIDFLLNSDDTNALIYFYKGIINRNRGEIIDALKKFQNKPPKFDQLDSHERHIVTCAIIGQSPECLKLIVSYKPKFDHISEKICAALFELSDEKASSFLKILID